MGSFKNTEYTRSYNRFRGVELGGGSVSEGRLSYIQNMYRDYSSEGSEHIESIPGFRKIASLGKKINSIFHHRTYGNDSFLIVHAEDSLYSLPIDYTLNYEPVKIATLRDVKSSGFSFGNCFYVLDGEKIIAVKSKNSAYQIGSKNDLPYVPTLYHNGEPFEQRNLLTDSFTEEFEGYDTSELVYETPGLIYRITDPDLFLCEVAGASDDVSGEVYIPSRTKIGNNYFDVTKIGDYAFRENLKITGIVIGDGVRCIGRHCFYKAKKLVKLVTPNTLTEIQTGAFYECFLLSEVHIGAGLKKLGAGVFAVCNSFTSLTFAGDSESFEAIEEGYQFSTRTVSYGVDYTKLKLELPIHPFANSISSVYADDTVLNFLPVPENGRVKSLLIDIEGPWVTNGKKLTVKGTLEPLYSSFGAGEDSGEDKVEATSAILGCRIAELFDGRLFLSGNPNLPNTVFYSARDKSGATNPLYIGEYNYFNDGLGGYPVVSMLAVRDSLAVFKSGDDGSGSIFYHSPKDTGENLIPKIYPVTSIHSGICAQGNSKNFLDDPVFLSPLGLSALEKQEINLERSVAVRSHSVNYKLLTENLADATLTEWLGYLAVCVAGKIFLADSRATFLHHTGNREYEWFYLCDIGTYIGDKTAYRYEFSSTIEDLTVHEKKGEICNAEVYSRKESDGRLSYYSLENGKKYLLYKTEERYGGVFSPAVAFLGVKDLLFFGTECGDVCIFNNDMRGIAPDFIKGMSDFNPKEYTERLGKRIHPSFYSFAGHTPVYAIKTAPDDCGLSHLAKDTVKHSLVIKCKSYTGAHLELEVGTDRNGFKEPLYLPGGELDFSETDFSSITFFFGDYFSIPLTEKEKNWVEKQIAVYSDSYASPIGIYSITYRYTVRGNIKRG